MISDALARRIAEKAKAAGIEPAALCAIVEVETAGAPFEADGRTPKFLFERHVFYRLLRQRAPGKLAGAVARGLAIPKWSRATQYRDEASSAGRMALIAKARAVDAEIADCSASWGLGQTMGFNCRELGFESAAAMVGCMIDGGIDAQLDCLVREVKSMRIVGAMNAHNWLAVALKFNGSGEAANNYHVRLADAWRRWSRKLAQLVGAPAAAAAPALAEAEIKAVQTRLRDLGFRQVGRPDGVMGTSTVGAISAFQAHEGLPVNGKLDDATRQAIAEASVPRQVAAERENATAEDLRAAGSRTIAAADKVGLAGKIKTAAGVVLGGGAGAEKLGLLDQAQDATAKLDQAHGLVDTISGLVAPVFANPAAPWVALGLLVLGLVVWRAAAAITAYRVEDHNTGAHAGPIGVDA